MIDDELIWFRKRSYLHFDFPISSVKAEQIVSNPSRVKKHSFFPFITFSVQSHKIKKDKLTKEIIKKSKKRPIAYSSHIDSHIYAYYSYILEKNYEEQIKILELNDNILAFRKLNKSNIEFALEAFNKISSKGDCTAVALDLSGFFDNLNHRILKEKWCKVLNHENLPEDHYVVFKNITKYSSVDKIGLYEKLNISKNNPKYKRRQICTAKVFRDTVRDSGLIIKNKNEYGIPQGSPMSALLSNIYMLDFDAEMKKYVSDIDGSYYRYCDDMLFIVPKEYGKIIAGEAAQRLSSLKVTLNTDKTEIREFTAKNGKLYSDKSLQYLGFIFDGENIFLRSSSLARFSERMKKGIKLAKATMKSKNKIRLARNESPKALFKEKIFARYSHVGKRNFLTYGYRAAKIMGSSTIRKQLKPLYMRLINEIEKE